MNKQLVIEAPAKVNLTLDVLGKRSDGYHELETVMHQISLRDIIHLQIGGQGIKVDSDSHLIPNNDENLAFRAAQMIYGKFLLKAGLQIFIEKNIPVGAGLAGGSTDAAAVIIGLNKMFDLHLEQEELLDLGLQIGSDVPFCLQGGTALATGRGETLTMLATGPQLEMVLVKPDLELSTAEVYREFRLTEVIDRPNNAAFIEAWCKYDMIGLAAQMKNVLETVSLKKCPEIGKIKGKLAELGALQTLMSGSGSSVVGLFADRNQARMAWEIIREQYKESHLVSSINRGDKNE